MNKKRYSELELAGFERAMGINLPDAYRRYLKELGAGSSLSPLEDWSQPHEPERLPRDFLQQPFPFTEAWNDVGLKDPRVGWNSAYYDDMLFRGSMRIKNLGAEGYHLLVVSGSERGNVWADERASFSKG